MSATSPVSAAAPVVRGGCWVWPYRAPRAVGEGVYRACTAWWWLLDDMRYWIPLALLAGAVPAWLSYATAVPVAHWLTAAAALPLLAAAVVRDAQWRGLAWLALIVLAQSAVNITLAAHDPDGLAAVLPSGARYWVESHDWIVSGVNPEYVLSSWLPAHLLLVLGVGLLTYVSLGVVPLALGLEQVDMMNFYVGRLVANSDSPWVAGVLGWHPWSVCRGIGCTILLYEILSWSLQRLTARPLSAPERRRQRLIVAGSFLLLDGIIKATCTEHVRSALAAHLLF